MAAESAALLPAKNAPSTGTRLPESTQRANSDTGAHPRGAADDERKERSTEAADDDSDDSWEPPALTGDMPRDDEDEDDISEDDDDDDDEELEEEVLGALEWLDLREGKAAEGSGCRSDGMDSRHVIAEEALSVEESPTSSQLSCVLTGDGPLHNRLSSSSPPSPPLFLQTSRVAAPHRRQRVVLTWLAWG